MDPELIQDAENVKNVLTHKSERKTWKKIDWWRVTKKIYIVSIVRWCTTDFDTTDTDNNNNNNNNHAR